MYKALLILLTVTILFAETNQTYDLHGKVETTSTTVSKTIEFDEYQKTIDSHKYVIAFFFSEWAGPAQMMLPIFSSTEVKMRNKVFFAKYDVDKVPVIAGELRIMSIPTLVLFENGQEINRLKGIASEDMILDFLDKNTEEPYNTSVGTYFHISRKLKEEQVISKLKGMALVINKDNNQTNHIRFWEEKNKNTKVFVSSKIQREYPSILEGLEPIKEETKKNEPEIKKSAGETTFYISKEIEKKYPELIKLIKETESMDDDERQYWFDIMPSMTESQVRRLEGILNVEKKKLEELEVKYQKEIKTLNEKHLSEWEEFQLKKKQEKELNTTTTNYDDMVEKIEALQEK